MKRMDQTAKIAALQKLNELLQEATDPNQAVIFLQAMDMICDAHQLEMPEEAISANIGLDDYFGRDSLTLR